ncbi:HRDC domain-containing protein [Deinococcus sp.]|uniref:HRDC domain-containing protein n=1 Tax=Deinococcus sp. TaxID=47478 RepID=UPI003C7979BD
MTGSSTPLETLLAQAHAQPGEPQARLSGLLSALEDADWTLLLGSQEALAAQLASLLGPGLIRLDPRLSLSREAFASVGLALASSDGDWKGARAVWLLESDERSLARARRADVPVIADATLAPGGRWLAQGAQLVVYRDAVTLTGLGDVQMSAVSGLGSGPRRVAAAPADLSVALALRDIGTLALRMNRRTRNTETLLSRFEGRALPVSGGVLLLEHDGPQTVTPLGGNLSAARAVPAGTLVTVGIEAPDDSWAVLGAVLMGEVQPQQPTFEPHEPGPEAEQAAETPLPEVWRETAPRAEAAPDRPRPALPVQPENVEPDSVQAEPIQSGAEPTEDFSDREFVFSPPPVLPGPPSVASLPGVPSVASQPDLPSVPSAASLPDDLHDDLHDDGRPAPRRNRGRRGKGAEASAPPAVTPEIVMSESFSRPSELPSETAPLSDQQATQTDRWPEELPVAPEPSDGATADRATADGATGTGTLDTTTLDTTTLDTDALPLQLPPDLPTAVRTSVADVLTDEQQAVYARLREWRNAEAKRQGLSSFIIASNATLAEVAKLVPYTEADLAAVRGMGPERLRKYGQKILEVVRG